jgi:hypothetical protein
MKNFLLFSFLLLFFFLFSSNSVYADLVNWEFHSAKCQPGERMVSCDWRSNEPFGQKNSDSCRQYKNNPNYRYLSSEGHSFGGSSKYCERYTLIGFFTGYIMSLVGTLIFEIPIFSLFKTFRSKKSIFALILANVVSMFVFLLFQRFVPFLIPQFGSESILTYWLFLIFECLVIILEAYIIKIYFAEIELKKIIFPVFLSNLISATIGSFIFSFLQGVFN